MDKTVYKALVIEPEQEGVGLLRAAFREVEQLSIEAVARNSSQALELLNEAPFSLILLSHSLKSEDIEAFIKKAKKTTHGEICSYVQIRSGTDVSRQDAASALLLGIDGFLFQPYSVEVLDQTLQLVAELNTERVLERKKRIIDLVLVDVITWIDAGATNPFLRKRSRSHARGLKKMQESLLNCHNADPDLYYSQLMNKFISLSIKKRPARPTRYTGASNRIRKKYEDKEEENDS